MRTNELKKGVKVLLRNGLYATLMDNQKGNIRLAEVYGFCTEIGSVYAHDILWYRPEDGASMERVEHTEKQKKVRSEVSKIFGC